MDHLHWEMSVLSRAVVYNNLSGAAAHIGLSQPQLSRIISKLERELKVVLLDREVRRKSSWTPLAIRLAETFSRSSRNLDAEVRRLIDADELTTLRVGTLEGLVPIALQFARNAFQKTEIVTLEMDVYDLNQLEEYFGRGDLDLIFTFREPGRKKYKYSRKLGYQSIEKLETRSGSGKDIRILSAFEHGTQGSKKRSVSPSEQERMLVSNSLALRKGWFEAYGGSGIFPSQVRPNTTGAKDEESVSLIAIDRLSPPLWDKISTFKF